LLGYVSGAINPDVMLVTLSTAGFYFLARGFRRGLTARLAIALGVVIALGLLTKVNFLGIAPGFVLGVLVLAWREGRRSRADALRRLGLAGAIAFSPAVIYIAINLIEGRPGLGIISSAIQDTGAHAHLPAELSYIWQRYLPHLPGMTIYFPGSFPLRDVWFNGFLAYYGWEDVFFSDWLNRLALIPALLIGLLGVRGLYVGRSRLRAHGGDLLVYTMMGVGMLVLMGADAYLEYPNIVFGYRSPRYLLPMLALACLVPALAARGAGRRWGRVAGVLIVCAFLAHDLFSQLLMVSNYYG
jgi:4-amino-4-deoxy-L-arabinose transferase-like glycosyltransferase